MHLIPDDDNPKETDMSKIDTPKASTAEDTQSKGCGCGGHGKHRKERAEGATADTPATSEHGAHDHAREPEHGSGCCGGHKTHK